MIENTDSLILEHLQYIRTDLDSMRNSLRKIKQRLSSLETSVARLNRDNASIYGDIAD